MQYSLSDVASYISVKINTDDISLDEYISTENMLPDKSGITRAASLPSTAKTNSFRVGDVLFSNIRTYFRKVWFATFKGGASNDVLVIRSLNEDVLFNKYLYYLLSDEAFIQHTITTAKGTKMPRGDKSAIMNYQFELPPLQIQKKIAHILSTLDDKIELNRKMNQTLEAMAQALFKSWFVDFDPVHAKAEAKSEEDLEAIATKLGISKEILDLFPSEFEESEMGKIPRGWEVKSLKSVSKVIMGQSPKGESYNIEGQGLPLLNGAADFTGEGVSPKKFTTDSKRQCKKGDLVFCIRATIGLLTYADQEYSLGRGVSAIASNEMYREIIYLTLYKQIERMKLNATGSVILGLKKDDIENMQIVVSSKVLLEAFHNINKNLFDKIEVNKIETATLQKTRDTLLPKLLSAELDVLEIE